MKKSNLILLFFLFSISAYGQLKRIYFNPEVGYKTHVQGAIIAHFNYGIAVQAGVNWQQLKTGYSNVSYGGNLGIRHSSPIRTEYTSAHLLLGIRSNDPEVVNVGFYAGTSYGKFIHKYNFTKVDNGSKGYSYKYNQETVYDFSFMTRLDFSVELRKNFGLNFGIGGIFNKNFTCIYGTIGFMIGRVKPKQ